MDTPAGPEPCAVLACRGSGNCATAAIERANAHLPEFQRISRWVLWPEPDLPRTSTGKVKRKPVAAWLARVQAAAATSSNGSRHHTSNGSFGPSSDWLLALIAQITGEDQAGVGDELRLTEDLHLDSLGRVQLAAAIEERLGLVQSNGMLEEVQTLGDLRKIVAGDDGDSAGSLPSAPLSAAAVQSPPTPARAVDPLPAPAPAAVVAQAPPRRLRFVYPTWPWWKPFHWIRVAFLELVARPLTWLLAKPRVLASVQPLPAGPLLIIGNHVTAYDAPLMQYALPGRFRRNVAVAMMGEMLHDFRHWRNPDWLPGHIGLYILGPPAYWLVTALFNVFPLPRQRDFQASFAHAGKALDRGYNVMVFPEGTRSTGGQLAPFRPGIGLLVKQSYVPVLPMAIRGLGELKTRQRRWFRSGTIEIRVGEAIHFAPEESESAITARLHDEVERLLEG